MSRSGGGGATDCGGERDLSDDIAFCDRMHAFGLLLREAVSANSVPVK